VIVRIPLENLKKEPAGSDRECGWFNDFLNIPPGGLSD
jgi:hypothetical protein